MKVFIIALIILAVCAVLGLPGEAVKAREVLDIKGEALKKPVTKKPVQAAISETKPEAISEAEPEAGRETPQVQGVITGGGRALAIIGGKAYRKGDTVLGHTITSIEVGTVVFESGGVSISVQVGR